MIYIGQITVNTNGILIVSSNNISGVAIKYSENNGEYIKITGNLYVDFSLVEILKDGNIHLIKKINKGIINKKIHISNLSNTSLIALITKSEINTQIGKNIKLDIDLNIPKPICNFLPLDGIDKIYFINLKCRPLRKINIMKGLINLKIPKDQVKPINAVYLPNNPQIGCALSHMSVLKDAIQNNYNTILVLEDDFVFDVSRNTLNSKLKQLSFLNWDLCLLSSVNYKTSNKISNGLYKLIKGDTTSAYLINKNIFTIIYNIFLQSVKNGNNRSIQNNTAIDVLWQPIQSKMNTLIFNPMLGHQNTEFPSDIEAFRSYRLC